MKPHTSLSDGEWKLMNCLWESAPRTITELVHALAPATGWSKHTVITMLSRLEEKGAVAHQDGARAKRYYPVLAREDAARDETNHFLQKVYGGSLGLMMSAMVRGGALREDDRAALSALLRELEGGGDDDA